MQTLHRPPAGGRAPAGADPRDDAHRRTRGRGRRGAAIAAVLLASCLALAGCGGTGQKDSASGAAPRQNGAADAASAAAGSGAGSSASSGSGSGTGSGKNGSEGADGAGTKQPAGVHIIRTASLSVRVADVPKAIGTARSAVADAGGIVGDETTDRDSGGHERSQLTLRVPQEHYDDVLDALAGTGRLVSRSVKAEDVTDQVVDVDSRVKSQRASVARVRALMDQATDLSDVVSLEGELSNREADLESLLAQQASLKDRTSLATITLSLTETAAKRTATESADDTPGFLDALGGGWHGLVTVVRWLAVVVGAVLPFAVPVALLLVLWLRLVRPRLVGRPSPAGPGLPPSGPARPAADPRAARATTAPAPAPAPEPNAPSAPRKAPAGEPGEAAGSDAGRDAGRDAGGEA